MLSTREFGYPIGYTKAQVAPAEEQVQVEGEVSLGITLVK